MKTYKIKDREQLNEAIEVGLHQLQAGYKYKAKDVYDKLKKKINKIIESKGNDKS